MMVGMTDNDRLSQIRDWVRANDLHRSGPMFGTGWEEASSPNWVLQLTPDTAIEYLHEGRLSQAGFEAFAHLWRTSVPRTESFWSQYEAEPTDPEVVELVSILRQALERR